jgi:hypothetical protein
VFSGKDVNGAELMQRVRTTVRGLVSHPNAITVDAEEGRVTLSGPILEAEVKPLIKHVSTVAGVAAVENRLEVHREPGNVPGLQGAPTVRKSGQVPDIMQANWSPTTRFIAGTFGGTMALMGARQLSAVGTAVAALGTAIFARALTNMDFKRLTGIGAGRGAVTIHKIINVAAPVERVFRSGPNIKTFRASCRTCAR